MVGYFSKRIIISASDKVFRHLQRGFAWVVGVSNYFVDYTGVSCSIICTVVVGRWIDCEIIVCERKYEICVGIAHVT